MIQETSRTAYHDIKPELGDRQKMVYDELVKLGDATNTEIASSLHIPINAVTPRIFELRQKGHVSEGGKRTCKITGRTVIYWVVSKQTLF